MARSSAGSIAVREKENRALELRSKGWTLDAIAVELGYSNRGGAGKAVERALARAPRQLAPERRRIEDAKLDLMERTAWKVLEAHHYVVVMGGKNAGDIVYAPDDGEPLTDHGAVLSALTVLLRIADRRARLHGLDAPVRGRIHVLTEDAVTAEIRRLEAEIAETAADEDDDDVELAPRR